MLSFVTVIILLFIFFLQHFLLEPMYQHALVNQIKDMANDIKVVINDDNIDFNNRYANKPNVEDNLTSFIFRKERETGTCISIFSFEENKITYLDGDPNGCIAYSYDIDTVIKQIIKTENTSQEQVIVSDETYRHKKINNSAHVITYTAPLSIQDSIYILIQAGYSSINTTIKTLTNQLIYLAVFMTLITAFIVAYLHKRLAKPLTIINDKAKYLPEGKYEIDTRSNKFKEAFELNNTLVEAAENIKKADKAKRDLLGNVSHDLRTPLTMITGYGEMMQDIPEENNKENLQVIIDEAKRLNVLVDDLLDLAKLQDDKIMLDKTTFNLTEVIMQELQKYEIYVVRDGYKIETFLADNVYINADKKRIEQVVNNFLNNAVHYDYENKHIIIREIVDDNNVQIQITDHGKGIEEKDIDKIWDRYFKIDKEHVRSDTGSGIGLSIVKEILDLHNAKYGVSSEPNKGSTFWFSFPIEKQ